MALRAQIVNAYLRDGHGLQTMTCYTFQLFIFAAVLYVDNTDLIHMTALVTATPLDLVQESQISTDAWSGLAIATGTALKPEKCFAYFLVFKFVSGCASMGNIGTLSPPLNYIPQITRPLIQSHLTVPLPDGLTAPIPTIPTAEAFLMLGV
jgi:hypothetical protein